MQNDETRKLYRYISYQTFTDMVQEQSLCFVRPSLWEDPYEGYLFQKLKTQSGREEVEKILDSHFVATKDFIRGIFLGLALQFEKTFYAQSWSLCADSDAMWRIYSFDSTAIRIEVTESNIAKLQNVEILDVSYEENIDLLAELFRVGLDKDRTDFKEIFRTKRHAFAHEQEVRLITRRNEAVNEKSDEEIALFTQALKGTNLEGVLADLTGNNKNTLKVSFGEPSLFFNSICLHPKAPDWFNGTVKKFCENNELPYIGKSKLYGNVI